MLSNYRVLDLTDEKGFLCAKVLADLGAEVIKIEKPGGDACRYTGPFYKDTPDPEKSLYWFAFNRNKKSITLDIGTDRGRCIFLDLVKTADIVVESFSPGQMEAWGLGYEQLKRINPMVVLASVSDYGQQGPWRDFKGSDLVHYALSGLMFVTGDPDRPPLAPSYPHSYMFGAVQAAIGILIALYHRETLGAGQHVDASVQMALTWVAQPDVIGAWDIYGEIAQRTGRVRTQPFNGIEMPILWQCKDGDIGYCFMLGPGNAKANAALAAWIKNDDSSVTVFDGIDWPTIAVEDISPEAGRHIAAALTAFFKNHTKVELFAGAVERGMQLYPSMTPSDTLAFEQLQTREFWQYVYHPELDDTLIYPGPGVRTGAPERSSQTLQSRRPPLIGEHNSAIFDDELGLSKDDIQELKRNHVI